MNITDIGHLTGDLDDGEDKVAKTAREKGLTVYEISKFFTEAFFKDCKKLNVVYPDKVLIASKHIPNMIEVVKILEEKKLLIFLMAMCILILLVLNAMVRWLALI